MTNPERIERAVYLNIELMRELSLLSHQQVPSIVHVQRSLDLARQQDSVLQALECSIRTGIVEPEVTR